MCFSFIDSQDFFCCKYRNILKWLRQKRKFISFHNKEPGVVLLPSGTAGSGAQTNAFGLSPHLGSTFFHNDFILRKAVLCDGEVGTPVSHSRLTSSLLASIPNGRRASLS